MNKPFTIILISFLTSVFLFGQEYKQFPTQDATWSIFLISSCDNENPSDTSLLRYSIQGDTTINETEYKKLTVERSDTLNPVIETVGGIREMGKQIFYTGQDFLGFDRGQEILLYDFNVKVGDTIIHDLSGNWESIVLEIDSVKIADHFRKRFKVDNGWWYHREDYIIEGMGSVINGLLGHITNIPTCGYHYWEHVCYFEEGNVLYRNPAYSDCYAGVDLSQIEPAIDTEITVFPIPFKEQLEIHIPDLKRDMFLRIHSVHGQLIMGWKVVNNYDQIHIEGPSGIYILSICDPNGTNRNIKIVKN